VAQSDNFGQLFTQNIWSPWSEPYPRLFAQRVRRQLRRRLLADDVLPTRRLRRLVPERRDARRDVAQQDVDLLGAEVLRRELDEDGSAAEIQPDRLQTFSPEATLTTFERITILLLN